MLKRYIVSVPHLFTILGGTALLIGLSGCVKPVQDTNADSLKLPDEAENTIVDPQATKATKATKALYTNLKKVSTKHLLFGHQDDLAYGVNWEDEPGRSDVKDVTGAYPAIIGWEIGDLETGAAVSLDKVKFENIKSWIKDTYRRGGISTISWHMDDPISGESSWYKASVVEHLIPGGKAHQKFKRYLDTFVEFNKDLTIQRPDGSSEAVPIILRLWHEQSGDWFWWGKGNTSEADYIALWRFTVEYLRDENNIHNLLYAYSPDRGRINLDNFDAEYLWGYPGDDYIDILGIDNYHDLHQATDTELQEKQHNFALSLQYLAELAERKNKVAALTEGGQDGLGDAKFWTERLLKGYLTNNSTQKIAYAMVWRNANKIRENRDHFYAPYPGHASVADFLKFYRHPAVLFEDNLPDMYKLD